MAFLHLHKIGRGIACAILCLLSFCFAADNLSAQNARTIHGRVTDGNGEPLLAASVGEYGKNNGVITDNQGNYSITVSSDNAVLVFSYIGMATQEIPVRKRDVINVFLEMDAQFLDDAVVIGYGQVKRSDLTGAVSTVKNTELEDRVITSLEDALRGKAAGVSIMQNDGVPGSTFSVKIRGASSVNASSTPIYVIDGIICDDAENISVGDVASIEIMKDASSTAIYGSRGANGVIMITTKQGRAGRVKVDLTATVGVQEAVRPYDLMDSREWAEMKYLTQWQYKSYEAAPGAEKGQWLNNPDYIYYRDSPAENANWWRISKNATYADYERYSNPDVINTDWQKAMFRPAIYQDYRLNLSGGTDKSKYSIMGSYLNQQGIVVFSGYEKYTGRLNYETQLSPKFKLITNLSLTHTKRDGLATGTSDGVTTSMLRQPPIKSLDDNDLSGADDETEINISSNPYYQAEHIVKDRVSNALNLRAVLDYNINKHWLVRITGTYAYGDNQNYTFYPKTVQQGVKQNGRAIWEMTNYHKLMNEDLVYYTNTFNKNHSLKVMAGFTIESFNNVRLTAENHDFAKEDLAENNIGQGVSPQVPTSSRDVNPYSMLGILGRVEYNLMNRYLFTVSMRADGSSRFGNNHKWGYFPSGAFAWKIDKEEFMKNARCVDAFKLRLSAGSSGNTAIPAFRTLSTVSTAFVPMDGNKVEYGIKLDRPDNDELKWETTNQYDAGIDLVLWKGALSVTVDAYYKVTKDLLIEANAPYYTGYRKAWTNMGSVSNRGIEISLGSRLIENRNFFFDANFNIAFNRSRVISVPGGEQYFEATNVIPGAGNFVVVKNGQPLGQWYGYKTDGVFRSQEEIDALPDGYKIFSVGKNDLRPGDHKFVNMDDNPAITAEDRTILGNGEPLFTGGFSFNIGYKNFELSTVFQYSYGADVLNANLHTLDAGRDNYNQTRHLVDAWTPTLYDASGELYYQGNPNGQYRMPGGMAENYCLSDFIEDGSFLRLSDVTLSYSFGRKVLHKLRISNLKLFVAGKNLYVWTKYFGFDPEVNTKQGSLGDFMPSLDFGSYPRSRTFSFGVNLTF